MKFVNSLFLTVGLVAVAGTFYVCIRENITPEDIINRYSDIVNHGISEVLETTEDTADRMVEVMIHQDVNPLVAGSALAQVAEGQARAIVLNYNSYLIDTTYTDIKQSMNVPLVGKVDMLDHDVQISLWSYAPGTVPVYFDLSDFSSSDIQIDSTDGNLRITATFSDAVIGRCRINHRSVQYDLLEESGMSDDEKQEYVSRIYLIAMRNACEDIESQALASGIIEQAKVQFADALTAALNGIYPNAEITIRFTANTSSYPINR